MLEMLLNNDKLCKENNLTYLLFYGTSLCVIRYKTFIPWNDDIDIYMPRQDFNKLCSIVDTKYSKYYEIISPIFKEVKNFASFAKIYKKGILYIEKINKDNIYPKETFIDIFPLDYMQNIFSKLKDFSLGNIFLFYLNNI